MLCVCMCVFVRVCVLLSRVQLFATSWTLVRQAPLSLGFSRKENWSGLSFPYPGIKPRSPSLQVDSLPSEPTGKSRMLWSSLNHCLTVLLSVILVLPVQMLPPRDSSSESLWFKLRGEKTFFWLFFFQSLGFQIHCKLIPWCSNSFFITYSHCSYISGSCSKPHLSWNTLSDSKVYHLLHVWRQSWIPSLWLGDAYVFYSPMLAFGFP